MRIIEEVEKNLEMMYSIKEIVYSLGEYDLLRLCINEKRYEGSRL